MIDRYTRPEMGHIFSLENKYAIWQEISARLRGARRDGQDRHHQRRAYIREHASFNKKGGRRHRGRLTNHDVITFLTNMGGYIDKDIPRASPTSRWVHCGMTSSDLGDTALCLVGPGNRHPLIDDCRKLGEICSAAHAEKRSTLCVGPAPTASMPSP